jgi:hypothetical protein
MLDANGWGGVVHGAGRHGVGTNGSVEEELGKWVELGRLAKRAGLVGQLVQGDFGPRAVKNLEMIFPIFPHSIHMNSI